MAHDIIPNRRASITILFANPDDALTWFDTAIENGVLQDEAALFVSDSLDEGKVSSRNEFIVRRVGTHPNPVTRTVSTRVTSR